MQPGCTIEALAVLLSTTDRQSPDSNSFFFDHDYITAVEGLGYHGGISRRRRVHIRDRHSDDQGGGIDRDREEAAKQHEEHA